MTPTDIIILLKTFVYFLVCSNDLLRIKKRIRYIWFFDKEEWCSNNFYIFKIVVFSLTVLEKNPQKIKLCNTKSKFVSSWLLKLLESLLAKIEKKNKCSIINKCMYVTLCYKSSTLKKINRTVILIFTRYHT